MGGPGSGPLKVPAHLRVVSQAPSRLPETVAETTVRHAPEKTDEVKANDTLSRLWDEIVPQLDAAGLVSLVDGMAITQLLRHYVISGMAMDELLLADSVVLYDDKVAGGAKKHPAEQVMRSESEMFLRFATQLGMTFASRARIPSAKADVDAGDNPFTTSALG